MRRVSRIPEGDEAVRPTRAIAKIVAPPPGHITDEVEERTVRLKRKKDS